MAEVAVEMKVFVESPEHIEDVKKALTDTISNIQTIKEEDVGFGIKLLRVVFLMDDDGGINEVEDKVNGIEHVNQCEVVEVSRI